MSSKRVLVVGGTGVTGPFVVNGLIARGHDVTIFHSGRHEVEFDAPVVHLHGDAHFPETIAEAIGKRKFDVTFALYGRLRHVADYMAGRTGQFISSGGVFYRGWSRRDAAARDEDDVVYSTLAMPADETHPLATEAEATFLRKAIATEQHVMELHVKGAFSVSHYRLPRIYGPRALAGVEWGIIRRLIDGRRRIIVPDGGMIAETRAYAANAAHMMMLALDHPREAAGQIFNAADEKTTTLREWVLTIARSLGVGDPELVSVPYQLAFPAFPYARDPFVAGHRMLDLSKAKLLLGYRDPVPFERAIAETVNWYRDNPPASGGEIEKQLGDAFDYPAEDALLDRMDELARSVAAIPRQKFTFVHPYRHPKAPEQPVTH
jgi:nucleoside-diphosphate-sugar epimerase